MLYHKTSSSAASTNEVSGFYPVWLRSYDPDTIFCQEQITYNKWKLSFLFMTYYLESPPMKFQDSSLWGKGAMARTQVFAKSS